MLKKQMKNDSLSYSTNETCNVISRYSKKTAFSLSHLKHGRSITVE
jgi:hypothetical protein